MAGDDIEVYAMIMQLMYAEIVPRLRDNVYGPLLPLAMRNFFEDPPLIVSFQLQSVVAAVSPAR